MAEDFQAGICGGSWWNTPKSVFMGGGSSPCSMVNSVSDVGTYGSSWMTEMVELKAARSSSCKDQLANSNNNKISFSDSSMVFQNSQKPQQVDSSDSSGGGGGGSSLLIDSSTLQMMGYGVSSSLSSSDWNHQGLLGSERAESYNFMLQEDMNSGLNSSQAQKDWSSKSFSSTGAEEPSITAFKAINQDFSLDQQGLNPVNTSTGNSTATCQGLSTGFSMGSPSYGYPSTVIQSLFEPDPPQPQQQSLFNSRSMSYSSNYGTNLMNELSPSWPKLAPLIKPSSTKQQQPNGLHFSYNTQFWNASATSLSDVRTSFLPSSQPQILMPTFEEKPTCPILPTKANEEVRDSGSVVKKGSEPAFKRPRIETPSPLPTFKVRKEKLGDRITALQQLVSPFGKTDTASVLHEAIEYIKFLHDQVSVLSTPYMKNNIPIQHQQAADNLKEAEGPKQDLRSRGLCLVPISSTFPVANETTADFWTPTFGGTFR